MQKEDYVRLAREAYDLGVLVGQAPTQPEAFTWCAIYNDGTTVSETSDNGFADVDQSRVKNLVLLPATEGIEPQHMDIPSGASPIFFRRRKILLQDGQRTTIHCIGWKRGDEAIYLFISDSGDTLLTDNLQAV